MKTKKTELLESEKKIFNLYEKLMEKYPKYLSRLNFGTNQGVYFLKNTDNGLIKIGCSKNIKNRVQQIKHSNIISGLSPKYELVNTIYAHPDIMYYLEQEIHLLFSDKRTFGEWFMLSKKDLRYVNAHKDWLLVNCSIKYRGKLTKKFEVRYYPFHESVHGFMEFKEKVNIINVERANRIADDMCKVLYHCEYPNLPS